MIVHEAKELSWDRLREEAQLGSLFVLTVAPLEDHASHLPCGTDPMICQAFTRRALEMMQAVPGESYDLRPINAVMLPDWYQGVSALKSLGCLRQSATTLLKALIEYGEELDGIGVRRFVILTSHGADSHMDTLERAASALQKKTRMRVLAPSAGLLRGLIRGEYDAEVQDEMGRPYKPEEKAGLKGDVHAAGWETSLILYLLPRLVESNYCHLPPHPVPKKARDRLKALRAHRGYFGSPSLASAQLGGAVFKVLCKRAVALLEEFCAQPVRYGPAMEAKARSSVPSCKSYARQLATGLTLGFFLFWLWDRD